MSDKLCPECINEFLKTHEVMELGDEVYDLHEEGQCSYGPNECNHSPFFTQQELAKARIATSDYYQSCVDSDRDQEEAEE